MNRKQIKRITENVIKRLVSEKILLDDENDDEYEDFDKEQLIEFCKNNDFFWVNTYYRGDPFLSTAAFSSEKNDIINDIKYSPTIEVTHEYDYLLDDTGINTEFENIKVIKIKDTDNHPYAIIYTEMKY